VISAESPVPSPQSPGVRALAAAVLAVLIVAGSAFLWIGVPVSGLWLAGKLTTTPTGFLFAAMGGIPATMIGFGWLLYRIDALRQSLTGQEAHATPRSAWLRSQSDERGAHRRQRAPRRLVDVAMTVSAWTALALLVVWFFLLAGSPLAPPGP
jgi:hypothetical protein